MGLRERRRRRRRKSKFYPPSVVKGGVIFRELAVIGAGGGRDKLGFPGILKSPCIIYTDKVREMTFYIEPTNVCYIILPPIAAF